MTDSQNYNATFISKEEVAKNTYSFFFKRPEGFEFIAGQFNRWTLSINALDGRGNSRFFTISSSPLDKEKISFTTKIIQSDFKKALLKLKENEEIKIFGPMGKFIIEETDSRERILIAGGIGITPFHSILTYASSKNLTIPFTLLVSFSVPEEMVFYEEMTELAKIHKNIRVVYTITRPEESRIQWNGEKGRISEDLIKKYCRNLLNSIFYVVGPPAMVESSQKMLEEMQIPAENIKVELFTGY